MLPISINLNYLNLQVINLSFHLQMFEFPITSILSVVDIIDREIKKIQTNQSDFLNEKKYIQGVKKFGYDIVIG